MYVIEISHKYIEDGVTHTTDFKRVVARSTDQLSDIFDAYLNDIGDGPDDFLTVVVGRVQEAEAALSD